MRFKSDCSIIPISYFIREVEKKRHGSATYAAAYAVFYFSVLIVNIEKQQQPPQQSHIILCSSSI